VLPHRSGRGRPCAIYAIRGYEPEDVVRTLERTQRMRVPAYSLVRYIKQLIMEDYLEARNISEISWRAILEHTRANCRGYHQLDIANLVARELSREGIKIWR